jgi:hypothetical protein
VRVPEDAERWAKDQAIAAAYARLAGGLRDLGDDEMAEAVEDRAMLALALGVGELADAVTGDVGTLRWFGESWGAPVCDPRARIEPPVGMACIGHPHLHEDRPVAILPDDQGVTMPHLSGDGLVGTVAYHLDCWLHEIGADRLVP